MPIAWTKQVWYYDYRTNIYHTLKKKPMGYEDLLDFVKCYNPRNRHRRSVTWNENDAPDVTRPIFCTNPSERVYITAWGCEIGSGRRNGLQAPGAGGL